MSDNQTPIKVFSQLYVGKKDQSTKDEKLILGFMTPYENNAAGKKRIATVDKWARGYPTYVDGVPVYKEKVDHEILKNESLSGFKFGEEIKRTYWGGGNVVWRVKDPRGFELEISSSNLAKILSFSNIKNGEILEKCFWGRVGAENVLIPEGCPEYSNLIPNAELFAKRKSAEIAGLVKKVGDVKIGDVVKLHNGSKGIYLGKWHIAGYPNYSEFNKDEIEIFQRHLILNDGGKTLRGTFCGVADFKPIEIDSSNKNAFVGKSIDEVQVMLNKLINFVASYGNAKEYKVVFINKQKFKFDDLIITNQIIGNDVVLEKFKNIEVENFKTTYFSYTDKKILVTISDLFVNALNDFKFAGEIKDVYQSINERYKTSKFYLDSNFYTNFCVLRSNNGELFTPNSILIHSSNIAGNARIKFAKLKNLRNLFYTRYNEAAAKRVSLGFPNDVRQDQIFVELDEDVKETIKNIFPNLAKDRVNMEDINAIEQAIKDRDDAIRNSDEFKCEINALTFQDFSLEKSYGENIDFAYLQSFRSFGLYGSENKKAFKVTFDNIKEMFVDQSSADKILDSLANDIRSSYERNKDLRFANNHTFSTPVFRGFSRSAYSSYSNEYDGLQTAFNSNLQVNTIHFKFENEFNIFKNEMIKFINEHIKEINLARVSLKDDKLFECVHYI